MASEKIIWIVPILVFMIGCSVVISLYFVARNIDIENEELQYSIILQDFSVNIVGIIDIQLESLDGLKNIFLAFDDVTSTEFSTYSDQNIEKYPGIIQALEWIPEVKNSERRDFENKASIIYNISNLTITGVNDDGDVVTEEAKPIYYPVFYINPLDGNEKALLFDLSSETLRLNALNKSKNTNEPSATDAITLVQSEKSGFLIFNPVGVDSFLGFILGVYDIENLIISGLQEDVQSVNIVIVEHDTGKILLSIQPLSNNSGWKTTSHPQRKCQFGTCSQNIIVVDKIWIIEVYPLSELTDSSSSIIIICVGLGFVIITTLAIVVSVIMKNKIDKATLSRKQMDIRDEFVSYIFHEIRVPFHTITIGVNNLIDMELSPDAMITLEIVSKAVNHSKHVMDDILDMSKIEKGKLEANKIFFDFGQMIQNVQEMFKFFADEKGVELTFKLDEKLEGMEGYGDDFRLNQSLSNYVSNAIKHTEKDGNVDILIEVKNINIIGEEIFADVLFEVKDTGCGISEENQKKLFTPYVQVEANKSTEVGTGLGLTITKYIIEKLHNGEIGLYSEEGKGSTFYFSFNTKLREKSGVEPSENSSEHNYENMKILIVDDNKSNTYVLSQYFSKRKAEVDVSNRGIDAIQEVKEKDYDVILMDRRMPGMNGIETVREIRKIDENVKIIGLTGNPEDTDIWKEVGVENVLAKPIDFNIFNKIIKNTSEIEIYL